MPSSTQATMSPPLTTLNALLQLLTIGLSLPPRSCVQIPLLSPPSTTIPSSSSPPELFPFCSPSQWKRSGLQIPNFAHHHVQSYPVQHYPVLHYPIPHYPTEVLSRSSCPLQHTPFGIFSALLYNPRPIWKHFLLSTGFYVEFMRFDLNVSTVLISPLLFQRFFEHSRLRYFRGAQGTLYGHCIFGIFEQCWRDITLRTLFWTAFFALLSPAAPLLGCMAQEEPTCFGSGGARILGSVVVFFTTPVYIMFT